MSLLITQVKYQRTWSAPGLFYKRYQPSVHMGADLVNMNSSRVYLLTRKFENHGSFGYDIKIRGHTLQQVLARNMLYCPKMIEISSTEGKSNK
jgi:hypothetical protein